MVDQSEKIHVQKLDIQKVTVKDGTQRIQASFDEYKEFILDPAGYFLIRTIQEKNEIQIGFCKELNIISVIVTGKKPNDIYYTFFNKLKEKIDIRPEHAAYLGKELQKAYTALRLGIPYVQDNELELNSLKE